MPGKRKAVTTTAGKAATTLQTETQFQTTSGTAQNRPEIHLRRSTRNVAAVQETSTADSPSKRKLQQGHGVGLIPKPDEAESESPEEVEEEKMVAKEGVKQAIEGLAKMERRLRRETKRAKLKIEKSFTEVKEARKEEEAFMPRPVQEPTPENLTGDSEYEDRGNGDDSDSCCEDGVIGGRDVVEGPDEEVVEPVERGAARAPAVNSSYLPLPWTGRLGYACLNTYLRSAKPPVFSSRTCRMASIIDHRHPLQDPSAPEHATKNRPDKTQDVDVERGQKYVQELGLANARDIVKMLRWNDKYGIRFMRLSSEMFPFASHQEHGYKLAPFASQVLGEAGMVASELGHRLTTHPGQFTQLGSPRKEVVTAAVRDLEYHDELLTLLRLPDQQNRDAVMILHMGGVFGDKAATLARFRSNYTTLLSPSIRARLVLENDDVSWSVHDLLPVCEELNIPLVLDYHHHNIIFDSSQLREGTLDISQPVLMERIANTWRRKGITQKMHYSEPCPGAVTPRDRRKHSPRVMTLPPCPPGTDLMIEAKDKEQAVFELMRTFRLPGFERINDMVPYERDDESKPAPKVPKKKGGGRKRKKPVDEDEDDVDVVEEEPKGIEVSAEDFGMGGPLNRVYWPPGMEEWLKPKKRVMKKGKVVEEDE